MNRTAKYYNNSDLEVTLEGADGKFYPFTILAKHAQIDRNGVVINFSSPDKHKEFHNYVLTDKSPKNKILNFFADYVLPYGLVLVGGVLVKQSVAHTIKDPSKAKNMNLALSISSFGFGVRSKVRSAISNEIKDLIEQWYDGEVAYYDVGSAVELTVKPIKIKLPNFSLSLLDD